MDAENLKELLRLAEQYVRYHGVGRKGDDVLSLFGLRMAKRTWWPHPDAKTYWLTFGLREIRWCIGTVNKKMKVPVEADHTSTMSLDPYGDPINDFDPAEEDRELPDPEDVNDFVQWRKELPSLLDACTPAQEKYVQRHLKGERLWDNQYAVKNEGVKRMRLLNQVRQQVKHGR